MALVAGLLSMSPAATAKTVSDVGSAALEMSGKLSISPEVAAADLDRQSALTKYAADVAAREPATLAEAYLDQGAGKLIILKTPGLADAVPNALASNVVFAAARFSWSQLISVQERVTTAARSDRRDVTTYLDARANTVVVQLRHLAEAAIGNLHRAIETSPAGSVRAEATWTPSYEATSVCNGAYCADGIMRGGFEIQSPEANQPGYVVICSAGFVANDSSGRPSLVTAGHCMPPSVSTGSWTDDQGVSVGVSDHYAYGGYYDAGDINMAGTTYAITLDPWILDYSYVTPQGCYVNCTTVSEDDQFVVTGTASAGQYVQGVYLCKDGRTTYHTCGSIDQLNVSENVCESGTSNCTTVNGFFGVNGMCSNGGDSGGPIFAPNSQASGGVAFGVVSNTNNYSTCPSGTETYSATMPNTVASLNVHILTGIAPASRPSDVIQV